MFITLTVDTTRKAKPRKTGWQPMQNVKKRPLLMRIKSWKKSVADNANYVKFAQVPMFR